MSGIKGSVVIVNTVRCLLTLLLPRFLWSHSQFSEFSLISEFSLNQLLIFFYDDLRIVGTECMWSTPTWLLKWLRGERMPHWWAGLTLGTLSILWWVNNHDSTSCSPPIFSELVKEVGAEWLHKGTTRAKGLWFIYSWKLECGPFGFDKCKSICQAAWRCILQLPLPLGEHLSVCWGLWHRSCSKPPSRWIACEEWETTAWELCELQNFDIRACGTRLPGSCISSF